MSDPRISVVSGVASHLGEGPTYDPATDRLYWFDIVGRRLMEKRWPDGETVIHALDEMASALATVAGGRHLLLSETGLHLRDPACGALERLVAIEADNAATRSNDARVHPCGAFWMGTMGKKAEPRAGTIYWFFRGELRTLYRDVGIPNSICFSPDGRTAYFTDTAENRLMQVACDPDTGLPEGEAAVLVDASDRPGGLDGSVVDADGTIWNARWGAASLDAWSPEGRLMRSIAMPASRVSCPAFVGADAARLVVTSAWQGMDDAARAAEPDAGRTFLIDLPVRGRHEPPVRLD